jgi:hypothetical protein
MKTKKLSVIIILSTLVLLGILIGTFSISKSEVSTSISSTWNNSKSIGRYNDSNEKISFPTVPIIVVYKAKKVGDINSQNPVIIDISDKDFGSLWFPLVKKSDYNFSVTCNDVHEIKTDSVIGHFIVNGEIKVSGHYNLIGSYSTETATNMIVEKVLNAIYTEIKKNLK